jgi:hypothetical protein
MALSRQDQKLSMWAARSASTSAILNTAFQLWQWVFSEQDLWLFVSMHFPVSDSSHLPSIVKILLDCGPCWIEWILQASLLTVVCCGIAFSAESSSLHWVSWCGWMRYRTVEMGNDVYLGSRTLAYFWLHSFLFTRWWFRSVLSSILLFWRQ